MMADKPQLPEEGWAWGLTRKLSSKSHTKMTHQPAKKLTMKSRISKGPKSMKSQQIMMQLKSMTSHNENLKTPKKTEISYGNLIGVTKHENSSSEEIA
jgi:hypothetical protein